MVVVPGHAYLLACEFLGSPDVRGQWPLPTAPPPKTTGGRRTLLDKILEMPSWPLRSQMLDVPRRTSWGVGVANGVCPRSFPRNVHANQREISHIPVFDLIQDVCMWD